VAIDLGRFHRYNCSDSLVPVLVSLYRWTPFYWEASRIGMLPGLLALPFHHPLDNLLVQAGLVVWAALALPFMLTRYLVRGPSWPLAGTLAAASWILLSSPWWRFVSSFGQPHYPVGLALGLGSLLMVEAATADPRLRWGRLAFALLLMVMAGWANASTGIILLPFVVCQALLRRLARRETILALIVTTLGLASCFSHRVLVPMQADPIGEGLMPLSSWPAAWGLLARHTWELAGHPGWLGLLVLAALAMLWPLVPALRRRSARACGAALALVGAATVYGLLMGTTRWAEMNAFSARYWIPTVFFLTAGLAIAVAGPPAEGLGWQLTRRLQPAAVLALALIVVAVHGLPSRARARAELERIRLADIPVAQRTNEILQVRATHLVGTYWQVWVGVFHANLVLHERGEDHVVWGVAHRCKPTWPCWGRMAPEDLHVALCVENNRADQSTEEWMVYFPPLELVEHCSTLRHLRAREAVAPSQKPASATEPLIASWYGGFQPPLSGSQQTIRGCGGSGKLNLTNRSAVSRTVTLRMSFAAASLKPCRLCIESPLFTDEMTLTGAPLDYCRVVTLRPGRHVVQFRCDGALRPHGAPEFPLVFFVGDLYVDGEVLGGK
jgi:hypothetical protein